MGLMALVVGTFAGCGGGGGTGPAPVAVAPVNTGSAQAADPSVVAGSIAEAVKAAGMTNGVSNASPVANPKMVFQVAGASPLTVGGAPVVNFAVLDSSGSHVPGLKLFSATGAAGDPACSGANVTFAMAKYENDSWQNLISRQRLAANTATQF